MPLPAKDDGNCLAVWGLAKRGSFWPISTGSLPLRWHCQGEMERWRKRARWANGGLRLPNWRASDAAEVGDLRVLSFVLPFLNRTSKEEGEGSPSERDTRREEPNTYKAPAKGSTQEGNLLGGHSALPRRQTLKGSRLAGQLSSHFCGSALARSPAIGSCLRLSNFKWPGGG